MARYLRPFGILQDAIDAARDNARYFNKPYAVFTDTNGNWRGIAVDRPTHVAFMVLWPDGHVEQSMVETTVGALMARRRPATIADVTIGHEVRSTVDGVTGVVADADYTAIKVRWSDGRYSTFRRQDGFVGFVVLGDGTQEEVARG